MRMKHVVFVAAALLVCAVATWAQSTDAVPTATGTSGSALTLIAAPGVSFPLNYWAVGLPGTMYTLTPSLAVDAEYRLGFVPLLFVRGGITYRLAPLTAGPFLSLIEATAGVGARFQLTPKIALKPYVAGGYHFGILPMGSYTKPAVPGRRGRELKHRWTSSRLSASWSERPP